MKNICNRTSQRESTPPDIAIKPIKSFLNANHLNFRIFDIKPLYTFHKGAKSNIFDWKSAVRKMKNIGFFGNLIAERESTSPDLTIKPIKSFLNANFII